MDRWRLLRALLLVVGVVLSPLHAVAATIPTIIAYDAAAWSTATTLAETEPSLRPERGSTPEYDYDAAHVGYDSATNSQAVGGAGAVQAYDLARSFLERHDVREGAIYGAPVPTPAGEGTIAAASQLARAASAADNLSATNEALEHVLERHAFGGPAAGAGKLAGSADIQGAHHGPCR